VRAAALLGALVTLVVALVPPIGIDARHYEFVETVQFDLLAFAAPSLFVLGWPIRLLRGRWGNRVRAGASHLADLRRRHPSAWRAFGFAAVDLAAMISWRTPAAMDGLVQHRWLVAVEAAILLVAGSLLWAELAPSSPFVPRLPRPWHAVLGAVSMWAIWVFAYAVGFSHASWYVAFHHGAGGLSTVADQELSAGGLWFGAAVTFVPLIFSDVIAWLHRSEDPDAELRALVRREHRWGRPS
jgi:cytochrome c oxidase assembly factor CtaG